MGASLPVIENCAALAFMLLDASVVPFPDVDTLERPRPSPAHEVGRLLRRFWPAATEDVLQGQWEESPTPWWAALRKLSSTATRRGPGTSRQITVNLRDPTVAPVARFLRLLPPELIRASVGASAGQVDAPLSIAGGELYRPLVDGHVHLLGAVPEGNRWRALMSSRWAAIEQGPFDPAKQELHSLVGEAQWLRMQLAEALLGVAVGWHKFVGTLPPQDRLPAGQRPFTPNEGVVAQLHYRQFVETALPLVSSLAERYGDPLQRMRELPADEAKSEYDLLGKCLALLAKRDPTYAVACSRYLWLRCAVRAKLILQPADVGLGAFAYRYVVAAEAEEAIPGIRRSAPENARLLAWSAAAATAEESMSSGVGLELRLSLGKEERIVHESALAVLRGVGAATRVALVQQLHRTHPAPQARSAVEAALAWRAGHPNAINLLTAADLAGPEAGSPPWDQCVALQLAKSSGLGLRIHAGESYGVPLVGLHWIMWCLTKLDLGADDRIGHALALLEGPRGGFVSARDWGFCLGWLAAETSATPALRDEVEHLFRGSGCEGALGEWVTQSMSEAPRAPTTAPRRVFVGPPTKGLWDRAIEVVESELTKRGVTREVCPSSNAQVSAGYREWVRRHCHESIGVLIGSDDPGILGTRSSDELALWLATNPPETVVASLQQRNARLYTGLQTPDQWLTLIRATD